MMLESPGFALADGTMVHPCAPFFIAGSGRCGTTLMRRLLIEHVRAVIPPENYLLAVSPRLMAIAQGDWSTFCKLVLTNMMIHSANWEDYGIDSDVSALLYALPAERRSIVNFWHAFHALYAKHAGRPSETRWGDKTPSNADALSEIVGIFPEAHFIFMVRDAFDMAYSYGTMTTAGRAGDYLSGAKRWVDVNTKLLAFREHHAARVVVVRYEDLVRDTDSELARVLDHLHVRRLSPNPMSASEAEDMARQPDLRNVLQAVQRGSVGKGRVNMPEDVKAAITAIVAPLQTHLGYEPAAIHNDYVTGRSTGRAATYLSRTPAAKF